MLTSAQTKLFRVIVSFNGIWSGGANIPPLLAAGCASATLINGIPLAVLECKSPNLQDPIEEAVLQLFGYKVKNEQFFYPNQVLVVLARYRATYASTFSPAKYFLDWKKSYPLNDRKLAVWLGKEGKELSEQDILLYSLFSKENFLDILRSYIVFEAENRLSSKIQ